MGVSEGHLGYGGGCHHMHAHACACMHTHAHTCIEIVNGH